ncbi:hypothetical protein ACFZAE_06270 [Streptomyces scabiei]|uniref:hypothetical protein n=1 Tax=Streptomyces TaxID=1883 RepID=UPI001BFF2F6C|nr:hypothetical protein [Streptomyces sp. ATCC 21386]
MNRRTRTETFGEPPETQRSCHRRRDETLAGPGQGVRPSNSPHERRHHTTNHIWRPPA